MLNIKPVDGILLESLFWGTINFNDNLSTVIYWPVKLFYYVEIKVQVKKNKTENAIQSQDDK